MTSTAPLSLSGSPTLALVPPGQCQLTETFDALKLIERHDVSDTSSVLRFELKDTTKPLNLSTCACILAKAELDVIKSDSGNIKTKESVIRPYTPISTNKLMGSFDLLVKNYGVNGIMSKHLCTMPIGESVEFKHISFNVKIQAPFAQKQIGMIVGGTGITPMIQALHAILGDDAACNVHMLYGSRNSQDILGKEMLDKWEKEYPNKLSVTHVLSHEDETNTEWTGQQGFITKDLIETHFPSPDGGKDVMIFVCGPPVMYDVFCGSRSESELSGVLKQMGYSTEQVFKF